MKTPKTKKNTKNQLNSLNSSRQSTSRPNPKNVNKKSILTDPYAKLLAETVIDHLEITNKYQIVEFTELLFNIFDERLKNEQQERDRLGIHISYE